MAKIKNMLFLILFVLLLLYAASFANFKFGPVNALKDAKVKLDQEYIKQGVHAPVPPSGLSAEVLSNSQIKLTWQDNSDDETGFKIKRSESISAGYEVVATAASNTETYTDTKLSANTVYYFKVCSYSGLGGSAYTSAVSTRTQSITILLTGSYSEALGYNRVIVDSTKAYAAGAGGIAILDVTGPASPSLLGSYVSSGSVKQIALSGDYLYTLLDKGIISVLDVSNTSAITEISTFTANANEFDISGSYIYAAVGKYIEIYDLTDVANPTLINNVRIDTSGSEEIHGVESSINSRIVAYSNYLFFYITNEGITILDNTNPADPSIIKTVKIFKNVLRLYPTSDCLYIGCESGILRLDLQTYTEEAFYTKGAVYDIHINSGYLYAAGSDLGLRIFKIENSSSIYEFMYYTTSGNAKGVYSSGSNVYICDSTGLIIIQPDL